jgi:hypothetical protein
MNEQTVRNFVGTILSDLVQLYCEKYRNPHLPPFVVHNPHTMTSWYHTPESSKPGCYVFILRAAKFFTLGRLL